MMMISSGVDEGHAGLHTFDVLGEQTRRARCPFSWGSARLRLARRRTGA
jgi:hypothetical protein